MKPLAGEYNKDPVREGKLEAVCNNIIQGVVASLLSCLVASLLWQIELCLV